VPSCTHSLCAATSGQYTTAANPAAPVLSLVVFSVAAASAPVANTLSTRSAGWRSSSARSDGTARRAPRSATLAIPLPVRNAAKCTPSYRPGTVIKRSNTRCPVRPATDPSSAMLSRVRTCQPERWSTPRKLRTGISWPSPSGPDKSSAVRAMPPPSGPWTFSLDSHALTGAIGGFERQAG